MPKPARSFKSHARQVSGVPWGILEVFGLNLRWSTWRFWRNPGIQLR